MITAYEVQLPEHYKRMHERVIGKTRDPLKTSVLELGCADGRFVGWLQQQGYNAEGIDGRGDKIQELGIQNLHRGQLTALDDVFGERKFDLVVAQGVFSREAQLEYKYGWNGALIVAFSTPAEREQLYDSLQRTIDQILENAYRRLTPRGFLLVREDNSINSAEDVDLSEATIVKTGFIIERIDKHDAVLQRLH